MKSEKQKEAKALYNSVLHLNTTKVPIPYKEKWVGGEMIDRVAEFELCRVNGEKYITRRSLGRELSQWVISMEKHGLLTGADFIHTRFVGTQGGANAVLIKTDVLLQHESELMDRLFHSRFYSTCTEQMRRVRKAITDTSCKLAENDFSERMIDMSEDAYYRRRKLLKEVRQEERAKANAKIAEPIQDELQEKLNSTLESLVSQIEEMGWEVTLRRKHLR